MALEMFAASLGASPFPCAARASFERARQSKPLQPVSLNVRSPARSVPSPKPSRSCSQLSRHACRAAHKDKSMPGDLGEFDLAKYVEVKVDSGESFRHIYRTLCISELGCCVVTLPTRHPAQFWDLGHWVTFQRGLPVALYTQRLTPVQRHDCILTEIHATWTCQACLYELPAKFTIRATFGPHHN